MHRGHTFATLPSWPPCFAPDGDRVLLRTVSASLADLAAHQSLKMAFDQEAVNAVLVLAGPGGAPRAASSHAGPIMRYECLFDS